MPLQSPSNLVTLFSNVTGCGPHPSHPSKSPKFHSVTPSTKRDNVTLLLHRKREEKRREEESNTATCNTSITCNTCSTSNTSSTGAEGSGEEVNVTAVHGTAFRITVLSFQVKKLRAIYASEFNSWKAMMQRHYRGVAYAADEFRSFRSFLLLMGPKPTDKHTLDRIDTTDPTYDAKSCRWADKTTQTENRSTTIWLVDERSGTRISAGMLAKMQGKDSSTIRQRKRRGWTDAEIIAGKRAINFTPKEKAMNPRPPKTVSKPRSKKVTEVEHLYRPKRDLQSIDKTWIKVLHEETGWFVPPLPFKDVAALKTAIRQMPEGQAHQIVEFAIKNWPDFVKTANELTGGSIAPAMPHVGFFVRNAFIAANMFLVANDEGMDGNA